jgi:thiol:disulfide interchange protein DsbA
MSRWLALALTLFLVPIAHAQIAQPQAAPDRYQVGKHYYLIEPAQPSGGGDKVDVVEVFSYACPACAVFQPLTDKWLKTKPVQANFSYLPAEFHASWEPFARAFFAAEALGIREKSHQALFNAIHIDHKPLNTIEDLAGFYTAYGVKKEEFLDVARSFAVETQLKRARSQVPRLGIDGTPSVVVAGKYRVSFKSAEGSEKVWDIVTFLVAKEAAAAHGPRAANP